MNKKVYTVSNRQTMLDLDDLSPECLWRISYFINFCLDNQRREQDKNEAEKKHLSKLHDLEEEIKTKKSNLKLSIVATKTVDDDDSTADNMALENDVVDAGEDSISE
jgi:hypothetical protein